MHIFVYEWVTGGGMLAHSGALPESLLSEGLAMISAVAEDFASAPGRRVSVLQDPRVSQLSNRDGELIPVGSYGEHVEAFEQLCRDADAVMLIAPEMDGIALSVVQQAEAAGARLISPAAEFAEVAANKQQTAERLAAAGLPTPDGVVLGPDEPLPRQFAYPAVLKPIDGAGSEDIWVVATEHDSPPPYVGPRRLEPFVTGLAASVAVLNGPGERVALPACTQRISTDGRLRYQGGTTPLASGLAARAEALAVAAVEAMPPSVGYVGVDLVLGANPDGADDRVIEINPRLTTSYTALRFAIEENPASLILQLAEGQSVTITRRERAMEFGVDGTVSYVEPDGQ